MGLIKSIMVRYINTPAFILCDPKSDRIRGDRCVLCGNLGLGAWKWGVSVVDALYRLPFRYNVWSWTHVTESVKVSQSEFPAGSAFAIQATRLYIWDYGCGSNMGCKGPARSSVALVLNHPFKGGESCWPIVSTSGLMKPLVEEN
jgi:hypothetical protein